MCLVGVLLWIAVPAAGQQTGENRFSRTVQVGRDSSLAVSNIAGEVTVHTGRSGEMRIEANKRVRGGSDQDAERVRIDVAEHGGRVEVRTIHTGENDHTSVDFTITVPPDASVDLRSISGNIQVAGVQGGVRAESVSGNVTVGSAAHLDRIKSVSGDVRITGGSSDADVDTGSISGNVTITNLKAPGLTLSTVSGDMVLDGMTLDRVSIRSVSGDVDYTGALARNGRYEISSHSGDITLRLAGQTGFEFDATSFSGDIQSDFPITIHDTGSDNRHGPRQHAVHGTFGDASALLTVRTFSGDVKVKRR
jgi:DUF4097 and DUF4098 domain-containing protein YvlB